MPVSTKTSTFHGLIIEIDIKNACPWGAPCGFQKTLLKYWTFLLKGFKQMDNTVQDQR